MNNDNVFDVAIVGAGIVGLSTALFLQKRNKKVIIIEKENDVAKHQSGRNSGVIHSGIYYKPKSLKSALCIRGRELLLEYLEEKKIPYKMEGKIIVDKNIEKLENLLERSKDIGMEGVKLLIDKEMKEFEPNVLFKYGLYVPQAGVVDYSTVSHAMKKDFISNGGEIVFNQEIKSIVSDNGVKMLISKSNNYKAKYLVNCGGLYSDKLARLDNLKPKIKIIPFRGEYYSIDVIHNDLINHMIYPLSDPDLPFLGIHLTKTVEGALEAGPNAVFAFAKEGYSWKKVNFSELISSIRFIGLWRLGRKYLKTGISEMYRSLNKRRFLEEINKFVPGINVEDLHPKISGVRAQAVDSAGNLIDDFYFLEGINSLHVLNAPSPAATASLAIGEYISHKVN